MQGGKISDLLPCSLSSYYYTILKFNILSAMGNDTFQTVYLNFELSNYNEQRMHLDPDI